MVMVRINVSLQGANRPYLTGWEVPLKIGFFTPGADVLSDTPLYDFGGTATATEIDCARKATIVVGPVNSGTYDITADSSTTLSNVRRGVHIP